MSTDPRAALARLIAALESHLYAVEHRRSELDRGVKDAYTALSEAFEAYDEALYDTHDEVTPFVLFEEEDDDDLDEDEDLDDSDDSDDEDDEDDDDSDDEDDDLEDEDVEEDDADEAGPAPRL